METCEVNEDCSEFPVREGEREIYFICAFFEYDEDKYCILQDLCEDDEMADAGLKCVLS